MAHTKIVNLNDFKVKEGKNFLLKECPTDIQNKPIDKNTGAEQLQNEIAKLSELQDKLYADNRHAILIVIQAMDAAGKDGTIKHILSGVNPAGVKVTSFKSPSTIELDHEYLWRHYLALPAKGEIGIFNRSHYENVLITKVHPEFLANEHIAGISSAKDINKAFWQKRYKQIQRFEKNLVENGTVVIKFFLHVSKEEQKRRFLDRIEHPEKNWKFSSADLRERAYWDAYQQAYEDAIRHTSTDEAPWYIIPADDKWFMRYLISKIINKELKELKLGYPKVSDEEKVALLEAKATLMAEQ
jgi:PPK2 family polyphosphate:nucleotide phosphotransferase